MPSESKKLPKEPVKRLINSSPPCSPSTSISPIVVSIISSTGAAGGPFLITVKCFSCIGFLLAAMPKAGI